MRTALKVFSKVLAFVLVFVLGFLTCVGAIVGVGYFVYSDITLDDIENLGGSLGTENIFKEDAKVDLTSLSLSQLINEINELSQMGETLTTEMLVDRYGLILSEQVQIVLNNEMQSIPLKDIFSGGGLNKLLASYSIGSLVFNYTYVDDDPEDDIPGKWYSVYNKDNPADNKEVEGIEAVLCGYTFDKFLEPNVLVEDLLGKITVSSILELHSEEFTTAYIGNEQVTLTEPAVIWFDKDGVSAESMISAIASMSIKDLSENINSLNISDFLGYISHDDKLYSRQIITDAPQGKHLSLTVQDGLTAEFVDLNIGGIAEGGLDDKINDLEIYKVLGYTRQGEEDNYTYYDQNGTEVTGIVTLLAGKTVGNIDQSIDTIKVGEVAGYKEVEGVWYDENDQAATGILASLADLTVNDLSNEETLSAEIKAIEISTVLGYTKNGDKYFNGSEEIVGVMAVLAGKTVAELGSSVGTITIAEIAGYTDSGRTDADGNIIWLDDIGSEVSGILPSLAHLTVDSITDNDTLTAEIDNIRVSVVLGYTKVGDKYYNGADEVTGVMSVIADKTVSELDSSIGTITVAQIAGYTEGVGTEGQKIWLDKEGNEVDGILSSLAELTVDDMTNESVLSDKIKTIKVYSALGYTEIDGKYFNGDEEVTGVMAALADKTVGELDSSVETITIAEIAGYTDSGRIDSDGDKIWLDKEEKEVTGILSKLADLKVNDITNESVLSAKIQTLQVADVLNYTLGDDGNYYKNVEDSTEPVLVTGAMAVIAGTKVANIQETIDEAYMGELIGYTRGNAILDIDGITVIGYEWTDGNNAPIHVLMKKVSNTKFKDVGELTNTLTLEDLVPEEERTGFISLVPPQTGINDIAFEVTKAFNEYSLLTFIECDAITFEADTPEQAEQRKNEAIGKLTNNGYGNMTLPQLIEAVSNLP